MAAKGIDTTHRQLAPNQDRLPQSSTNPHHYLLDRLRDLRQIVCEQRYRQRHQRSNGGGSRLQNGMLTKKWCATWWCAIFGGRALVATSKVEKEEGTYPVPEELSDPAENRPIDRRKRATGERPRFLPVAMRALDILR